MAEIERIFPPQTPSPRGPYSPAVRAGDFIYVSGQGPCRSGNRQALFRRHPARDAHDPRERRRILAAAGASPADVVKCNVYLKDAADFAAMNVVYREFFGSAFPARTTVAVALPDPTMKVEIEAIAYKPR